MNERSLSLIDQAISGLDSALRTLNSNPARASRSYPADGVVDAELTEKEAAHAAALMRVNHAGEIAAQGLYHGHAAVARDPAIENQMKHAAAEELDHLAWCEQRLQELDSEPSALRPIWYGGAFLLGTVSGAFGDRWALGFVAETERQVAEHLTGHLDKLPDNDERSRSIVRQMRDEEEAHGDNARDAGALPLPPPIGNFMRMIAKIMTRTAYRV